MKYPKVIVITLNWNKKDVTIDCLKSLFELDYPNYEIVVVDNGSTDGSAHAFKENSPIITIIENKTNLGYGGGFNVGIKYALSQGVKYVLIINNDTIADKGMLAELVKVAESDSNIGIVSGKVYLYYEPNRLYTCGKTANFFTGDTHDVGWGKIDLGQYDKIKEYEFLDDCFWLVKTEVFKKAGMYDQAFFIYYEESDLCTRVSKAGFKLMYTPYAKIWHKVQVSTGGGINPIFTYHMARSRIVFMRRNSSSIQFIIFLFYCTFETSIKLAVSIKNKRFNCILPQIKGVISGLSWAFGLHFSR